MGGTDGKKRLREELEERVGRLNVEREKEMAGRREEGEGEKREVERKEGRKHGKKILIMVILVILLAAAVKLRNKISLQNINRIFKLIMGLK